MIRKAPDYTHAVQSNVPDNPEFLRGSSADVSPAATICRPCTQVLALVEASEPSNFEVAGDGGLQTPTCHAKDVLHDGPDSLDAPLTLFCRLDSQKDFMLDPRVTQGNKRQAALVLISSVLQRTNAGHRVSFMGDSVHLVNELDVATVKSCLKRVLCLTTLAGHMSSRKRTAPAPAPLAHEESPAKAAKCPALGPSPTGTDMPEFSSR